MQVGNESTHLCTSYLVGAETRTSDSEYTAQRGGQDPTAKVTASPTPCSTFPTPRNDTHHVQIWHNPKTSALTAAGIALPSSGSGHGVDPISVVLLQTLEVLYGIFHDSSAGSIFVPPVV